MPKFIPRQRKHKARERSGQQQRRLAAPNQDTNATELIPASKDEREARRQRLRDEFRASQPESKVSSKKRKRLDKYIDLKLKKEENLNLIKKLADHKIDTSLLRSSKKLGRGKDTKRERMSQALQESRVGIDNEQHHDILFEELQFESDASTESPVARVSNSTIDSEPSETPANITFGSGLKRPLEFDESGAPIIKKKARFHPAPKGRHAPIVDESEWQGFSTDSESVDSDASKTATEVKDDQDHFSDNVSSIYSATTDESEAYSSSDESDIIGEQEDRTNMAERSSAFKFWATQLRNDALGFQPSSVVGQLKPSSSQGDQNNVYATNINGNQSQLPEKVPKPTVNQPQQPKVIVDQANVYNVPVARTAEMEEARSALPVVAEEQKIMEAIHKNDCTVVWGATGSGKTTQVPQFLFEAGYGDPNSPNPGMIGITQPRRVAAVSMAKRVATEFGDLRKKVAHQIRFDSSVSRETAIKFMTDGVLLREISEDFTLSKYSAIIIDEAHERSVNTDMLIGMLTRIVETRSELSKRSSVYRPLKLVIMSATLQMTHLLENKSLFRKSVPPVVQAEGRQYPVSIHFARRTQRDYVEEVFKRIQKGHRKLPAGGMLVFLTGQNEIMHVMKKLKAVFESSNGQKFGNTNMRVSAATASIEAEDLDLNGKSVSRDDFESDSESEITGVDNDEEHEFNISSDPQELLKVHILPLYSQLPTEQQMLVFDEPPPGSRLIVLATNVAETSLTIPGIRYVFDCGRAKEKRYDRATGVQNFEVSWVSKANADQRAGRAGRTGPGHCYRMYSSAVYERDFTEFAEPEILRVPVEGVILQLKSMGIPSITSFPFPTSPDRQSLLAAERLLGYLGAIRDGEITELGKIMSSYPLSPRLSKMIYLGHGRGVVEHAIGIAATLAVPNMFIPESQLQPTSMDIRLENESEDSSEQDDSLHRESLHKEYNEFHAHVSRTDRASDACKMLTTLYEFSKMASSVTAPFQKFTRTKALLEALKLRQQLFTVVSAHFNDYLSEECRIPTKKEILSLRYIVTAGYIDQVAMRADLSPNPPENTKPVKRATDQPYLTLFPTHDRSKATDKLNASNTAGQEEQERLARMRYVYIHPSSVLAHMNPSKLPQYIIYSHLSQSSPRAISENDLALSRPPKIRLHPLTPITASELAQLASNTTLCEEGKPIGKIEQLSRSADDRERRIVWTVPTLKGEAGSMGWPLPPARQVSQVRLPGKGWVNE